MNTYRYPIEILARSVHEINKIYCESIGDTSQVHWEEAPQWQKISCVNGVIGVLNGNTPEQSHESWLKEKLETGWKFGKVKNIDKKEHPCFVPYSDLPEDQKLKDEIFVNVVRTLNGCLTK